MALKNILKGKNSLFLYLLLLFLQCLGCKGKDEGFRLQRFELVNTKIQSLIDSVYSQRAIKLPDEKILTLQLRKYDSIPEFWFAFIDKKLLAHEVHKRNFRIVGYLNYRDKDILVFSNMNDLWKFEQFFFKFLIPKNELKVFDFIHYDTHQYDVNEKGNPIPDFIRFRPSYRIYIFDNNRFKEVKSKAWFDVREN